MHSEIGRQCLCACARPTSQIDSRFLSSHMHFGSGTSRIYTTFRTRMSGRRLLLVYGCVNHLMDNMMMSDRSPNFNSNCVNVLDATTKCNERKQEIAIETMCTILTAAMTAHANYVAICIAETNAYFSFSLSTVSRILCTFRAECFSTFLLFTLDTYSRPFSN